MGKGLIESLADMLFDMIFDDKYWGGYAEKKIEKELKKTAIFGENVKVYRNLYVPKKNGETSEIDVMLLTQRGIFVIESKFYSGWIFGNEIDQYWTASLPNGEKNRFYNPIKQNKTHIKWLKEYIQSKDKKYAGIPVYSLIVFANKCELKKITIFNQDVKVIKKQDMKQTIKTIFNNSIDILDVGEIEFLNSCLEELTHVNKDVKKQHIKDINEKYKKKNNVVEKTVTGTAVCDSAGKTSKSGNGDDEKDEELTKSVVENKEKNLTELVAENKEKMSPESIVNNKEDVVKPTTTDKEAQVSGEADQDKKEELVKSDSENNSNSGLICPKCGSKLVLRTAKKGKYAGNEFLGCSAFPKCRFTRNIDLK